MTSFKDIYQADVQRSKAEWGGYLRVWYFLFRKSQNSSIVFLRNIYKFLFRLHSNRRGLEIGSQTKIGKGLYLGHAYNITINPNVIIGMNCNIHKGVVIGQTNRGKNKGTPVIGDQVWIGINAAIVGNITIGNDVLIAPNSYVNCDVPSHSVVFGNPCIIKHKESATEGYVNNIVH